MSMHSTRSQANRVAQNDPIDERNSNAKRVADDSPDKVAAKKRSVFDDLTNAAGKKKSHLNKKTEKRALRRSLQADATLTSSQEASGLSTQSSQESSVVLHLEEENDEISCDSSDSYQYTMAAKRPPGVEDFDKISHWDIYAVSLYAMDIFDYYRDREEKFQLHKYMVDQPELSKGMRAILVDWLVEVQESFELNHETLYLSVKIIDLYLMKNKVAKAMLQLLGATAIFISCKFDERSPPLVDDFLYICDDAYSRKDLLEMEQKILKALDFDLGIPLSYRFLRRYARCARASMEVLTLARFILETSLMDFDLIPQSDSKLAASCLYLALKMKNVSDWTPTLEFFSSYKATDLENLSLYLNNMIAQPNQRNLQTIRTKYSHKVFFEVAKIPPLPVTSNIKLDC